MPNKRLFVEIAVGLTMCPLFYLLVNLGASNYV